MPIPEQLGYQRPAWIEERAWNVEDVRVPFRCICGAENRNATYNAQYGDEDYRLLALEMGEADRQIRELRESLAWWQAHAILGWETVLKNMVE